MAPRRKITDREYQAIVRRSRRRDAMRCNHGMAISRRTHRLMGGEFGAAMKPEERGSFIVPTPRGHEWTLLEQKAFTWLLVDPKGRERCGWPTHWEDFCREVLRHTDEVLERWRNDKAVREEFQRRARSNFAYRRAEVDAALVESAKIVGKEGDAARRLFKEETGDVANYQIAQLNAATKAGAIAGGVTAGVITAAALNDLMQHLQSSKILADAVERERDLKVHEGMDAALESRIIENAKEVILAGGRPTGSGAAPGAGEDAGEGLGEA